jgi:hypothetical protein
MMIQKRMVLVVGFFANSLFAAETTSTAGPCTPIDRAGYVIDKPGHYCVTRDLHTRLDFADHSAERAVIEINSSDVTLDLQGHRLGRGWLFVQPGGSGILIGPRVYYEGRQLPEDDRMENITIENGMLTDHSIGIDFYRRHKYVNKPIASRELKEIGPDAYRYETSNVLIRNVVFKRCTNAFLFQDWAPSREEFLLENNDKPANYRYR